MELFRDAVVKVGGPVDEGGEGKRRQKRIEERARL